MYFSRLSILSPGLALPQFHRNSLDLVRRIFEKRRFQIFWRLPRGMEDEKLLEAYGKWNRFANYDNVDNRICRFAKLSFSPGASICTCIKITLHDILLCIAYYVILLFVYSSFYPPRDVTKQFNIFFVIKEPCIIVSYIIKLVFSSWYT